MSTAIFILNMHGFRFQTLALILAVQKLSIMKLDTAYGYLSSYYFKFIIVFLNTGLLFNELKGILLSKNNKTALDLDSAQNQAIFKLYHQWDHDLLCLSGNRLMAMICTILHMWGVQKHAGSLEADERSSHVKPLLG